MMKFTDKTNEEEYDFELFNEDGKGAGLLIPKKKGRWELYIYNHVNGWIEVNWNIDLQCFINVYEEKEKISMEYQQIAKDLLKRVKTIPDYRLKWLNQVPEPLMNVWKEL